MTTARTTTPKPRRRWLQFSLRGLMIFVLIVSVPLGWLGMKLKQAREQRAAVEAIGERWRVHYDYQFDASGTWTADAVPPGLSCLRKLVGDNFFANVVYVSTPNSQLMAHVERLPRLRVLDLSRYSFPDDGLEHVPGLTEVVLIEGPRSGTPANMLVTDHELDRLQRLPQLRQLYLQGTPITDAGLAQLRDLRQLRALDVSDTRVTDQGLALLSELNQLLALNLSETQVTDSGVVHLRGFTQLQSLWLAKTSITDAGSVHLQGLTQLRVLYLNDTKVTDAGVAELQKALPNCTITR